MNETSLPLWALDVLRSPATEQHLQARNGALETVGGVRVAVVDNGIVRFPICSPDDNIEHYRSVGGANFHERAAVPFAMSSLDTPIYHAHVDEVLGDDRDDIVVDVGGGDGRLASHCLSRGYRRIVVIDAVAEALVRFRRRVAERDPADLDRLLLIEADSRALPLRTACAASVIVVEALCYLNEDYEIGLRECVRLLAPSGRILVSDRDYEGGLVLRLLYHGLDGLLQLAGNRSLWDGSQKNLVRSRCLTQAELVQICRANSLKVLQVRGTPILSLILGYLNGRNLLDAQDAQRTQDVGKLLTALGQNGAMRRCNVVIAERDSTQ